MDCQKLEYFVNKFLGMSQVVDNHNYEDRYPVKILKNKSSYSVLMIQGRNLIIDYIRNVRDWSTLLDYIN